MPEIRDWSAVMLKKEKKVVHGGGQDAQNLVYIYDIWLVVHETLVWGYNYS